jgi:hypothetical protein
LTTTANRDLPATEALIVSLDEYIRARYGLLAVQTFEEERFLRFMAGLPSRPTPTLSPTISKYDRR